MRVSENDVGGKRQIPSDRDATDAAAVL